jgi:hypothetical protein
MTSLARSRADARHPARLRERDDGRASNPVFATGNPDLLELPKTAPVCPVRCPGNAILNKVDQVLAQHLGFKVEELDFIRKHDIKYRFGRSTGEDEE